MADIQALKNELTNDPLGRGYSGMNDREAFNSLTSPDRTRIHKALTGDDFFKSTDKTEYAALTDTQKSHWLAFCGRETIDPSAQANIDFVTDLFGSGSTTVNKLNTNRQTTQTRAQELNLGNLVLGDIIAARR